VRANSNKAAARITLFPGRKCDAQMMKNSVCRHRRSGSNPFSRIVAENRNNPGEPTFYRACVCQQARAARKKSRALRRTSRFNRRRHAPIQTKAFERGAICFAFSAAAAN